MNRRMMAIVFAAAIAAIVLTGCGTSDVATTASQSGTAIAQGIDTLSKSSLNELGGQLPSIEAAIDAGKTEEARAAFNSFLTAWDGIKDAAKAAAPESAAAIQTAMDNVKKALVDAPTPNASDVKMALNDLETQMANLANSLQ